MMAGAGGLKTSGPLSLVRVKVGSGWSIVGQVGGGFTGVFNDE